MLTLRARWICFSGLVVVSACGIDASQTATGSFDAASTGAGGSAASSASTFVGAGGSSASAGGAVEAATTVSSASTGSPASSAVGSGAGGAANVGGSGGASAGGGGAGSGAGGAGGGGAGPCAPSDPGVCCEGDLDCGAELCCLVPDGSGLMCADTCNGGLHAMPCDDTGDCPTMTVCCAHSHHAPSPTIDSVTCKAACDAIPLDPTAVDGGYQLCDTTLDDCPMLLHCQADPRVGGARHGICM
jgi:hypothetical protein